MNGGGSFTSQNKILGGIYINFINLTRASLVLAERGFVAFPMATKWGADGITTLKVEDFEKDALKLTGYPYDHDENKPIREIFKHSHTLYLGRINGGGNKAQNTYGTAKFAGTRGNDLKTVISFNVEDSDLYDVATYLGSERVDVQTVESAADLVPNDFVIPKTDATLAETAGTAFTGGSDETVAVSNHQDFLNAIEPYSFNILGCAETDASVQALYVAFEKRMREQVGVKFQVVMYNKAADYEGCINLKTKATEGDQKLVYWLSGMEAGCAINKSCGNKLYDGEYTPIIDLTQEGLENAVKNGEFVLHKVGTEIRTLSDINSLVTLTDTKGEDFKENQTIRTIDQIGNDMAVLFNTKYHDEVPNDQDGRISLWNDIISLYKQYATKRAIAEVDPDEIKVEQGETKRSVVIDAPITVINCMKQAYMRVIVR